MLITKKGFSLLELLVVMAIVGILITIAYPSYRQYITHARRHDGQAALIHLANRMEGHYAEQHSYQFATLGTGKNTDIWPDHLSPEGWYTLSIISQTTSTFTLQAKARKTQALDDSACQELTLNHLGIKGDSINTDKIEHNSLSPCW